VLKGLGTCSMGKRIQRALSHHHRHGKGQAWQGSGLLTLEDATIDRDTALAMITQWLSDDETAYHSDVQKPMASLIALFNFTAEDLLEGGVAYETVCAMEKSLFWNEVN
jgi:hypothetical protein